MSAPAGVQRSSTDFNSAWDAYYQSYLQVVHNQSVIISGYVLNSFALASAFIGPFVGM